MAHTKPSSGLLGSGLLGPTLWVVPLPMSLAMIVGSCTTVLPRPGLRPTLLLRQFPTNAFWQVLWSTPTSWVFTTPLHSRVLSSCGGCSTASTASVETDPSTRGTYSLRPTQLLPSGSLHIYTSLTLSTTALSWPRFLPTASFTWRVCHDHASWYVRPALHTLPVLKAGLVARWASAKFRALPRIGTLPRVGSLLHTGSLLHVAAMLRIGTM